MRSLLLGLLASLAAATAVAPQPQPPIATAPSVDSYRKISAPSLYPLLTGMAPSAAEPFVFADIKPIDGDVRIDLMTAPKPSGEPHICSVKHLTFVLKTRGRATSVEAATSEADTGYKWLSSDLADDACNLITPDGDFPAFPTVSAFKAAIPAMPAGGLGLIADAIDFGDAGGWREFDWSAVTHSRFWKGSTWGLDEPMNTLAGHQRRVARVAGFPATVRKGQNPRADMAPSIILDLASTIDPCADLEAWGLKHFGAPATGKVDTVPIPGGSITVRTFTWELGRTRAEGTCMRSQHARTAMISFSEAR